MSHIFVRHLDFAPMKRQPTFLSKCNRCQMIYLSEKHVISELKELYYGEEYARGKKTMHAVFNKEGVVAGRMMSPYYHLADYITKNLEKGRDRFRILDIGCFDGKLLVELKNRHPHAVLHGFDISEHIEGIFPKDEGFKYFSKDISSISGPYDIIIISSALMFIDDFSLLMNRLNELLAPGGFVFLFVTNVEINPYNLVYGDHYIYPTPTSLRNFLNHYGYESDMTVDHPSFPRNILAIARRKKDKHSSSEYAQDNALSKACRYLTDAAIIVKEAVHRHITSNNYSRVAVLGCTCNATWAYHTVGDMISFFVDENPYRVGSTFCGMEVIHPRDLEENDLLVIPYAETARPIAEKFSKLYKAKLFMV